ncbi:MAG TPA: hypothetical protein VH369_00450 [Bryobacteraceae bacterium]
MWARSGLRFVLVGETHGTRESPAIFGDLVCSACVTKRPVIVGLEFREQQVLDRFLESRSHELRIKELLSADEWKGIDGRASNAMLLLLERLRDMKADGFLSSIVAFSAASDSAAQDEEAMAATLIRASVSRPDSLVIVLTGNVHASKKKLREVGRYRLMGSFLPTTQTISLLVTDRGGEAWNCQSGSCEPHKLGSSGGMDRGITLAPPYPGYDGILSTGLPATASIPAKR